MISYAGIIRIRYTGMISACPRIEHAEQAPRGAFVNIHRTIVKSKPVSFFLTGCKRRFRHKIAFFLEQLHRLGIKTRTESAIVPIVVGNSARALAAAKRLREEGIFVSPIRYPSVPENAARLRLTCGKADRRGIHSTDGSVLKAIGQSGVISACCQKLRKTLFQGFISCPKELLSHICIPRPVRIGKTIAAWRGAASYLLKGSGVIMEVIAKIVQAQRMRQVSVHHGCSVTEGTKGSSLNAVFFCEIICDSVRNPA